MLELNLVLVILLVEALLLALLTGLGVVFHARRRRRRHGAPGSCDERLEASLARLLAETRAALQARERLGEDHGLQGWALRCRVHALEVEHRLAPQDAATEEYWQAACTGYSDLPAAPAASAGPSPADTAGPPSGTAAESHGALHQLHGLLETQQQGLDRLSAALAALIDDPEQQWEQEASIQSLREATREMAHALAVLEDENRYLFHRLETLEHREATPGSAPVRASAG